MSNKVIFQYFIIPISQDANISIFCFLNIPISRYSNVLIFQYLNIPIHQHPMSPYFNMSITLANFINSDIICCHHLSSDLIWCHLMLFSVIWCHMMSSDYIWCHMTSSDVTITSFKLFGESLSQSITNASPRGVFTTKNINHERQNQDNDVYFWLFIGETMEKGYNTSRC